MIRNPIIKLCADTPKLKLRLGTRGCDGSQVITDAITIHITRAHCGMPFPVVPTPPIENCNGCPTRVVLPTCPPIQRVTLVYPALGVDMDGLTEFYFDDKLFSSPPGRYVASVIINECSVMGFDIDLCCDPISIEQIVLEHASPVEENC